MLRRFSRVGMVSLLLAVFMAMTSLSGVVALAAGAPSPIDYLYERSLLRGDNPPSSTTNLTDRSDKKYTASWSKVYEYTYTNYRMCTGDSTKRFKVVLDANCYGDSSENPPVNGTITVKMYNSSGTIVATWSSSNTTHPTLTKYYTPTTSTSYYYFRIELTNCVGYSAGKLTVSLADK